MNLAHPEPVEDLVYGTPPPEDAHTHSVAAYNEAYASHQCNDVQPFPARELPLTDFFANYQTTTTLTSMPTTIDFLRSYGYLAHGESKTLDVDLRMMSWSV
jgi:hypothetical protein